MIKLIGSKMYMMAKDLFPICRSLTGNGVRKTLEIINEHIPISIKEVPTGTKAFDWQVPKEWNIKQAYLTDDKGEKIVDFNNNNLHVLGYSEPVNKILSLDELQNHLYSLPEQPDAIPYVTSYYEKRWGFCLTDKQRKKLKQGNYQAFIESTLEDGSLTYGEVIIPGKTEEEIFLSTYICHPSMANNELSGPVLTTFLAKWLLSLKNRKYTYRIIFIPETIGAIVYLSKNLETMKKNVIAGFNITCVGDDRTYSYLPSRTGNSLADRVAIHVLDKIYPNYNKYSFLERGSDERQYCSPGVDLPVVSIMRSKYGSYPEYHTSLDNLDLISASGLEGSFDVYTKCIGCLEHNRIYSSTVLCEPQLGKRGLYPTLSTKESGNVVRDILNFITYCDGNNDLLNISDIIGVPIWRLYPIVDKLTMNGLIVKKSTFKDDI